jgi:F0F1-type ATP synthase membrane subunit b/b'
MKRVISLAACAFCLLAVAACSQESEGPAEQAGKQIDEAVEEAQQEVDETVEQAAETLEEAGDEARQTTSDY